MAIFVSTLFSSIRGSVAGTTYLTTPSGQIIGRQKTNPVNPQSGLQTARRAAFAENVAAWETLTSTKRVKWQDYADSLGAGQTGRQVFLANLAIAQWADDIAPSDIAVVFDPPTDMGVLPISNVEAGDYSAIGTGIAIKATNPNLYDVLFIAQRSRQFSSARNTFQGPFDPLTNDSDLVTTENIADIVFEELVEGGIYFIRIVAVKPETFHIVSASYIIRTVAVTNEA